MHPGRKQGTQPGAPRAEPWLLEHTHTAPSKLPSLKSSIRSLEASPMVPSHSSLLLPRWVYPAGSGQPWPFLVKFPSPASNPVVGSRFVFHGAHATDRGLAWLCLDTWPGLPNWTLWSWTVTELASTLDSPSHRAGQPDSPSWQLPLPCAPNTGSVWAPSWVLAGSLPTLSATDTAHLPTSQNTKIIRIDYLCTRSTPWGCVVLGLYRVPGWQNKGCFNSRCGSGRGILRYL